ncbi:Basic-leucine zipper transcription factor [Trema orientale]|uniref:Basic-leucine zipper transcription factor n=1 Tax=Trema orientale TaxID=63057 RepID=A0A2P5FSQ7_TREOI|nr:Basic-leucine zipper transcription factor [Trema orientale]
MLSSSDGEEIENSSTSTTTKSRSLQRVSSSSSKKSSSSSSRSGSTTRNTTTRTMEEVWKDINLSSLSESTTTTVATPQPIRTRHTPTSAANFRSMIFQDFLGRPFCNDTPPPTTMVTTPVPRPAPATLYGPSATVSPLPHPATALSLNSGPEFHFLDTSPADPLRPNSHHSQSTNPVSNISSFATPFESLGPTSCLLPSFGKKRFPSTGDSSGSGDRRHKRMIKNREVIIAYTNELELEVTHLMEENARLRKEQEQFHQAAATTNQLPKKYTLHRTSTAPF